MTSVLAADPDVWGFELHPEVWLIVGFAILLAWYTVRVIAPKVVPAGEPVVTTKQKVLYALAIFLLWVASYWPVHDIAEEYLYSVHMIQHMLITLIVPPLLLLAMPEWLARLLLTNEDGEIAPWLRRLAHPVVAGLIFNFLIAVTHLPWVVNTSATNGPFHYAVHFLLFASALLMWTPVVSPLPELRLTLPQQMLYLFVMSILPTIPAGFLTWSDGALYDVYDHDVRVWGLGVQSDQQAAGLIMKLLGGIYLWSILTVLFFRWAFEQQKENVRPRRVLTTEHVENAFDEAGEPPRERVPPS